MLQVSQDTPDLLAIFRDIERALQALLQVVPPPKLDPLTLVVNLAIAGALGWALAWHYSRFGRSLASRVSGSKSLLFVCLTTVLIISIVKSSVALSLGLVGALSIIRFRTPVKDPEELAYIFMSIAMGVGLGADQRVATLVAFAVILGAITIRRVIEVRRSERSLYLTIETPEEDGTTYRKVLGLVAQHVTVADLRRLDSREGKLQTTFFVVCRGDAAVDGVIQELKETLPGSSVNVVDQEQILAI